MSVSVRNNNVDQALKIFKTQVAKSGTLSKARERAEGYKNQELIVEKKRKKI